MTGTTTANRNLDLETALCDARSSYVAARPKSQACFEAAKAVMPGGNTRSVLHFGPYPFTVAKGAGARIWDVDGHTYADFLGEYTAGLYGHSNPIIEDAVTHALQNGLTLGGPNAVDAKFAQLMCDRFLAIERLRFCNSGTEANILSLSAARAFTGRTDILVMDRSYHGGVLTFSGDSPLNLPFPIHRATYNNATEVVEKIHELGDTLAAVLVEPMVGAGGAIPGTHEFLQALRDATQATGAMLIFDEVMTSRLTAGGLQGHHQIKPDLATFGKYLGGGLTFGAFGGRADIMDRFDPERADAWGHAGTFNNNILTMTAGHTGLEQVFTPQVADTFFNRGNAFRSTLKAEIDALDLPVQITGLGSMMALHFAQDTPSAPPDSARTPSGLHELIHLDMMERGQFYARRGMMNMSLPMTNDDLDRFRMALTDTLEARAPLVRDTFDQSTA